MEITEVRIQLMDEPGERLLAFCSITFDDEFVVRDLKIIKGPTGPFVAMPSRKLTARCPRCRCKNHFRADYCNQCGVQLKEQLAAKDDEGRAKLYVDVAHPISSACRAMIQQQVIRVFEEEKARSKLAGYVSNYDDFEPESVELPPHLPPHLLPTATPTRVQEAEKLRGPHKLHTQGPQSNRPHNDGFGAGIFE